MSSQSCDHSSQVFESSDLCIGLDTSCSHSAECSSPSANVLASHDQSSPKTPAVATVEGSVARKRKLIPRRDLSKSFQQSSFASGPCGVAAGNSHNNDNIISNNNGSGISDGVAGVASSGSPLDCDHHDHEDFDFETPQKKAAPNMSCSPQNLQQLEDVRADVYEKMFHQDRCPDSDDECWSFCFMCMYPNTMCYCGGGPAAST